MNPGEDALARSRWFSWLPVLGREERRSLFENFQASGVWNVDFTIMMGLSTAPLWARRARIGLILATVVLIIPLGNRLQNQLDEGQVRPATYPLPGDRKNKRPNCR